jgi:hypothetical protein
MYSEFEVEFKDQMLFNAIVLKIEGSISTYTVTHMQSANGHTIFREHVLTRISLRGKEETKSKQT